MADRSRGQVVAIILAAGASTRLGRPKQLLDLGGKPVIVHVVERALSASLDGAMVVTGGAGEAVAEAVAPYPVRLVPNPAYREGQSTSLIAGLNALPADVDAVVVLLGDQPGIDPADIDAVAARRRDVLMPVPPVVMTAYGSQRSHPILFGREVFPELLAISGDQGGRDVIRARASDVVAIASVHPEPPLDLDTEEAYRALLRTWPTS
ncbi:MAG: nucleotidyltransferase family protein [Thermomicrobiales bacterium]